jgi:Bacterial Ig domain
MGTSSRSLLIVTTAIIVSSAGPAALAGGNGGCAPSAPRAAITNTWAWQAPGSWGLPGQKLTYSILVFNQDVGCGSSGFVVGMSAPSGFAISIPTNTITLASAANGYVWAYVTSPATIADGDYPLTVTVDRAGSSAPSAPSGSSSYKVYSSDTVAPTLVMPKPADGATIKGRSYSVSVTSSDDHAVKQIDLSIDGVYTSTTQCADISYQCLLHYGWAIRKIHGRHTATFRSTDWKGNAASLSVTFTVN